ncbi:MAG: hypothetical protein IJE89_01145 [Bacilli bacterium]|nr:hypothetical protein [Bacilli bacterium]
MEIVLSKIEDINMYDPYVYLKKDIDSVFFEDKFLEYFKNFSMALEKLKETFNHKKDKEIDKYFRKVVKKRNDIEIEILLNRHYQILNAYVNNDVRVNKIKRLRENVRKIKDIILISEPTDGKRLKKVDELVSKTIDSVSNKMKIAKRISFDGYSASTVGFFNEFNPDSSMDMDEYAEYVKSFKVKVEELCDRYRGNYSVSSAEKYIESLYSKFDKLLDKYGKKIYYSQSIKLIDDLVVKYSNLEIDSYDKWISEFKEEIVCLKDNFKKIYSDGMYSEIVSVLDKKTSKLIDKMAINNKYLRKHDLELERIYSLYKPEDLDIFDIKFYSSYEDRDKARSQYYKMTKEQQNVFEMRIYEEYIRIFKANIRKLNDDIRRVYSKKMANEMIDEINKDADLHIREKAKMIGKPIPRNSWLIRKKLWADVENFTSLKGVNFRKKINPFMRFIVRNAMKNKLVIEDRAELDSTKQYIFVPTHYFTEDAIGMFASLDRQAYMLMGTTDQIENNPLLLAALMLGFFHVDRMDDISRRDCVSKQNRIIDYGTNFINYVSGSWENSENELQPLSFSGPYRTAKEKGVEIVPVSLYLVKEDKKIYVRYGNAIDISKYDEKKSNELIRDTLASMHFKQMSKHSKPIETIEIEGYGKTHNLPYEQHIAYMESVADEYWGQYWSKPFAKEEIGVRAKKEVDESDVYSFVDELSRDKLVELASQLSEPMLRRYQRDERYNIVKYIDENYERLKNKHTKVRKRVKGK